MTDIEHIKQDPFLERDSDGNALVQLKLSLVLYLDYAPGPKRARRVYDAYMGQFGKHVKVYQSTSWPGPPDEWNDTARKLFEDQLLPAIQRRNDWGYVFTDAKRIGNHLFMFHGYRPVTEAGRASFFRFEWPWDTDPDEIQSLAVRLADTVPFLSGTGGYIISANPSEPAAYDRMFALCRRYWGLEAWDLDVTTRHVLHGYKCTSWLTLIGSRLLAREFASEPDFEAAAKLATNCSQGIVFRSRNVPAFIDRNRRESCDDEQILAVALEPLQITEHDDFSGPLWEGRTLEWLRRFSESVQ